MKKIILSFIAILTVISSHAEIPSDYYSSAEGLSERELKTALHRIISNHKDLGYQGLWLVYLDTDVENGLIVDMYSTCSFTPQKDQCGNYKNICDCYNREHTIPQSWFYEHSPMKADAFHVYPTDGKVNGMRGNLPHGETDASPIGNNGLGKIGLSSINGYSGNVYEPDDEFKGDIARTYFYFVTCYEDKVPSFKSDVFTNDTYPSLSSWFYNLMLEWHRHDPVSEKEINRQEAVYKHQFNRNPFIDYPELAEHIWGNKKFTKWHLASHSTTPETVRNAVIITKPNSDYFQISAQTGLPIQYEIFSVAGYKIASGTSFSGDDISTSGMNKGIYIIHITIGNHSNILKLIL